MWVLWYEMKTDFSLNSLLLVLSPSKVYFCHYVGLRSLSSAGLLGNA